MSKIYYFSHTKVIIDPTLADIEWPISDEGQRQLDTLLRQDCVQNVRAVFTSDERKTRDAAKQMAEQLGIDCKIDANLSGADRSGAGFLSNEDFALAADLLYQKPDESAFGWESASSVLERSLRSFNTIRASADDSGDIAIWGHGDGGTILLCGLLGVPISRQYDQPKLGCFWVYDCATRQISQEWKAYS